MTKDSYIPTINNQISLILKLYFSPCTLLNIYLLTSGTTLCVYKNAVGLNKVIEL